MMINNFAGCVGTTLSEKVNFESWEGPNVKNGGKIYLYTIS